MNIPFFDNLVPRKLNNPVTIGLTVALAVALGIIAYMWYHQPQTMALPALPHPPPQQAHKPPSALPDETHVGENTDKPTLVLFWGSWCGHSTHMKPEWDKVANILNSSGTMEAKDFETGRDKDVIDQVKDRLPGFRGFPDIRLYTQGFGLDKPCIQFQGERKEENLLKFAYTGK